MKRLDIVRAAQLTKREMEVFEVVIQGYTTKNAARILNISPRTVEYHSLQLLQKFGTRRRTELLVLVAWEAGVQHERDRAQHEHDQRSHAASNQFEQAH